MADVAADDQTPRPPVPETRTGPEGPVPQVKAKAGGQPPTSPYSPFFQTYMTYSGFCTSPFSLKAMLPSTVS